jgi:hypothetical protein
MEVSPDDAGANFGGSLSGVRHPSPLQNYAKFIPDDELAYALTWYPERVVADDAKTEPGSGDEGEVESLNSFVGIEVVRPTGVEPSEPRGAGRLDEEQDFGMERLSADMEAKRSGRSALVSPRSRSPEHERLLRATLERHAEGQRGAPRPQENESASLAESRLTPRSEPESPQSRLARSNSEARSLSGSALADPRPQGAFNLVAGTLRGLAQVADIGLVSVATGGVNLITGRWRPPTPPISPLSSRIASPMRGRSPLSDRTATTLDIHE